MVQEEVGEKLEDTEETVVVAKAAGEVVHAEED